MSNIRQVDFLNLAPYVRYVHEFEHKEQYAVKVPPRIIYDYEMIFMIGGSGSYRINDRSFVLNAGDLCIIPPFVQNSFLLSQGQYCHYIALHFDLVYMGHNYDFSPEDVYVNLDYQNMDSIPWEEELTHRPHVVLNEISFPDHMQPSDPIFVANTLKDLLAAFVSKEYGYHLRLRILLLQLLEAVVKDIATNDGVGKRHKYRETIAGAIQIMKNQYKDPPDFRQMASDFGLSLNYFRTLFKEATGKAPLEYVIQIRMDKAKELLTTSNYSVGEISVMVGYDNIHHFSKLFKKIEGISPKHYLESLTGRKGVSTTRNSPNTTWR
jgi:AraC-like DNA-binding protein